MLRSILSQGNFAVIWPSLSVILFFTMFLGLLFWVFRRKAGEHYTYMSQLTMDDQTREVEKRNG